METSLIGKALDFGSNEYGFESRVSNIFYTSSHNYILNHLILNSNKKKLNFEILYTKKNIRLVYFLNKIGLIKNYFCFTKNQFYKIKIFIAFYKFLPICKNLKLLSTPSRSFYVSYKALSLLHNRTLDSLLILSTSRGLITHLDALKLKIGGKILFLITF